MRGSEPVATRDRILSAAKHLFQRRGYYAVGTAEILDAANAPKGSMYHHFPQGKEQIAIAAVVAMHDDLMSSMHALQAKQLSVANTVRALAKGMARWLKASDYREGTTLTSTTIGCVPDLPNVHAAIKASFDNWQAHIAERLVAEGHSKASAVTLAQTLIAGMEGAMILARVQQDARIVTSVAEVLARQVDRR